MLAQPRYFDVPAEYLTNSLVGPFNPGQGGASSANLIVYDARTVGSPDRVSGRWVYDLVHSLVPTSPDGPLRPEVIPKVFRRDLYDRAMQLAGLTPRTIHPVATSQVA
jgi:hypothetical protein